MRILLCNTKTGLYFQSPDGWTAEPMLAEDFRSSLKAALFAQEQRLKHVEVLVDFDDPEYNVHLPVQARLSYHATESREEQSAA